LKTKRRFSFFNSKSGNFIGIHQALNEIKVIVIVVELSSA